MDIPRALWVATCSMNVGATHGSISPQDCRNGLPPKKFLRDRQEVYAIMWKKHVVHTALRYSHGGGTIAFAIVIHRYGLPDRPVVFSVFWCEKEAV